MDGIARHFWLAPVLPFLAAAVLALAPRRRRRLAGGLSIGALGLSLIVSLVAFGQTLGEPGRRWAQNFTWLRFGDEALRLGWVLDPLGAAMLVMVAGVGLCIFIYSLGYMAHDPNFTRFFGFLSLFAGAMLGVVIANSLLLLFICWELVGLASYLLIGFWYQKPEAAAAAKKAFITTRIGDLALFLGMLWLYAGAGTLVFYDGGSGCLEAEAVRRVAGQTLAGGLAVSTAIGLLVFVGAMGKSGQLPLHVWLPDAMEGPTPVSALIHAATMVAAGVFLVARMYPLMAAGGLEVAAGPGAASPHQAASAQPVVMEVVTWVGAVTAVFAALIAVAQTDIKRILAYSTVSQLGYMFLGLGVGGVAVGMFHLLTHACFKALLFLGAGSVIHGCHEEQDIRRMGGLRRVMPVTFATYAVGMMALAGVPLVFSGFWSKDGILHAAHGWGASHGPFWLGLFGALLTAFYMTRQGCYVFFGSDRSVRSVRSHESPTVMTIPLVILAVGAVLAGFFGTPAWPWAQGYLEGRAVEVHWSHLWEAGVVGTMALSSLVVFLGIGLGWWLYGRRAIPAASTPDVLEVAQPGAFAWLRQRFYVDELYEATVIRWHAAAAGLGEVLDRWVWGGLVLTVSLLSQGLAWASRFCDEYVVNLGFDVACRRLRKDGRNLAGLTDGKLQNYLRSIGTAVVCLLVLLLLLWGGWR
jgi:NADH-quinone oxidoreductase subunit L